MDRIFFNYQVNEKMPEYLEPLVGYLHASIPEDWEIYVQPYLNGLRPDLLLLHENRGIHIIECKPRIDISIRRLKDISENIKDIYCPRMSLNQQKGQRGGANIFTSFADLSSSYDEIEETLRAFNKLPSYYSTISKENLNSGFESSLRLLNEDHNFNFDPVYAEDLRAWLRPSAFKIDNVAPLPNLDHKQLELVEKTTPKFQRFTGSAGSGKTFVLAAKAAHLISENKKVLFLTYNKTLINYIYVLVQRNLFAKGMDYIEKSPSEERKVALIEALRAVTEGKIFLEPR